MQPPHNLITAVAHALCNHKDSIRDHDTTDVLPLVVQVVAAAVAVAAVLQAVALVVTAVATALLAVVVQSMVAHQGRTLE